MARGWESKSIEAQQEEASSSKSSAKPRLTKEEADRRRKMEGLQLSLRRITEQIARSQNDRHRQILEQAETDLQCAIKELEKNIE